MSHAIVERFSINKCHKLLYSLVITWSYQHQMLSGEVKNSARAELLSFN